MQIGIYLLYWYNAAVFVWFAELVWEFLIQIYISDALYMYVYTSM